MTLTLMAVHAHPDDEGTLTGASLARYAAEGVRTVLVTCTDGRCGDGPGGVKPGEPGHDPDAVVAMRREELEVACRELGVTDLELLGYRDSGMVGWSTNDDPGAFMSEPVEDAGGRLAALYDRYRPDVVVTYDENGNYGHPDHIQANRITVAALDLAEHPPAKVYWAVPAASQIAVFREFAEARGLQIPEDVIRNAPSDDDISTWVDARAQAPQKRRALAAHGSQGENMPMLQLDEDRFADVFGRETFQRVRDSTGAPTPEDDLFAGLR